MNLRGLPAQLPIMILGGVIAVVAAVALSAENSNAPAESPEGLRLGRSHLLNDDLGIADARNRLDEIGYAGVKPLFEAALDRDPGSAQRWIDYGEVAVAIGSSIDSNYSYDRARKLAPGDVSVLYDVGDFYATHGHGDKAIDVFALMLKELGAPKGDILTQNVFTQLEGLRVRQNGWLDRVITDAPNARAYLKFLTSVEIPERNDAVEQTWNWLAGKGYADDGLAAEYSRFMIAQQKFEQADRAWKGHFTRRTDGDPANLAFNGSFEYEFLNGTALDWHYDGPEAVHAIRDTAVRFAGKASTRLEFTANDNPDFHHFSLLLPLKPGRYRLSGRIKTASVTGDEGIRLRAAASVPAETAGVSGTADWTELMTDFEVTAAKPAVEIQVARRRSLRIDNQLKGTAWVDAVRVVKL